MIRGTNGSWLVPLADLSLILFIVTGGALTASLGREEDMPATRPESGPAEGVSAAIFVDAPGAPPLAEMLAAHPVSAGEQLTVQGYYAQGHRGEVVARVERLATQAIAQGVQPRVILQPASQTLVIARFAHDADPELARGLQIMGE